MVWVVFWGISAFLGVIDGDPNPLIICLSLAYCFIISIISLSSLLILLALLWSSIIFLVISNRSGSIYINVQWISFKFSSETIFVTCNPAAFWLLSSLCARLFCTVWIPFLYTVSLRSWFGWVSGILGDYVSIKGILVFAKALGFSIWVWLTLIKPGDWDDLSLLLRSTEELLMLFIRLCLNKVLLKVTYSCFYAFFEPASFSIIIEPCI